MDHPKRIKNLIRAYNQVLQEESAWAKSSKRLQHLSSRGCFSDFGASFSMVDAVFLKVFHGFSTEESSFAQDFSPNGRLQEDPSSRTSSRLSWWTRW